MLCAPDPVGEVAFAAPFARAVVSVFDQMLGCRCHSREPRSMCADSADWDVSTAIGMSGGTVSGRLVFHASATVACEILRRMTGLEAVEIDEFVRDVLGEMANMIAGAGKRDLDFPLLLSLPEVRVGVQAGSRPWSSHAWLPLDTDLGACALEIGFEHG